LREAEGFRSLRAVAHWCGVFSRTKRDDELARYVWMDRVYRGRDDDDSGYDARRYAIRVLRELGMPGVNVAVFHGHRGVQVETGRDWGQPAGTRWATVSVAPWASREDVATALVTLAGRESEPNLIESLLLLHEPD
jgi:hypothetical protein